MNARSLQTCCWGDVCRHSHLLGAGLLAGGAGRNGSIPIAGIWLAWVMITSQGDSRRVRAVSFAQEVSGAFAACHRPERVSLRNRESRALVGRLRIGLFGRSGGVWAHAGKESAASLGPVVRRAVSLLTVVQYFTSEGKVFWLFRTEQERVLGPFLYKNQCAAFLELVFPLAVYQSLVDRRQSLLYVAMAAAMFAAVIAAVSRAGVLIVVSELIAILLFAWFRGLIPAGETVEDRGLGRWVERRAGGGRGLAGHAPEVSRARALSRAP